MASNSEIGASTVIDANTEGFIPGCDACPFGGDELNGAPMEPLMRRCRGPGTETCLTERQMFRPSRGAPGISPPCQHVAKPHTGECKASNGELREGEGEGENEGGREGEDGESEGGRE